MNHVINLANVEEWPIEKHKGVFSRMLIEGQNMTVMWTRWEPGANAPVHVHPNEQSGIVLAGTIIFTINGVDYPVSAGEFFYIPPSAPVREDLHRRRFQAEIIRE